MLNNYLTRRIGIYAIIIVKLKTEDYVGVKQVKRGWKSISEREDQMDESLRMQKSLDYLKKR